MIFGQPLFPGKHSHSLMKQNRDYDDSDNEVLVTAGNISPRIQQLLVSMLKEDPRFRINANEALKMVDCTEEDLIFVEKDKDLGSTDTSIKELAETPKVKNFSGDENSPNEEIKTNGSGSFTSSMNRVNPIPFVTRKHNGSPCYSFGSYNSNSPKNFSPRHLTQKEEAQSPNIKLSTFCSKAEKIIRDIEEDEIVEDLTSFREANQQVIVIPEYVPCNTNLRKIAKCVTLDSLKKQAISNYINVPKKE
jgi:uncharacterized protein (UPF0297 family)